MHLRRSSAPRLLPDQLVVTGERHHSENIQQVLTQVAEGRLQYRCVATLTREHDNPHDQYAVAVLVNAVRVGYVAQAHSEAVAQKLRDNPVQVKCIINWNGEIVNGIYRVKLFPNF